jgi:hypothetical protein
LETALERLESSPGSTVEIEQEQTSWLQSWKLPSFPDILQAFLGPFIVFIILESGS